MQEKSKTIVILGSGEAQVPFIKNTNDLFYKTIVFDIKAQVGSTCADEFYELSIFETNKILEILKKEVNEIVAVIARVTNIQGLRTASAIAKYFNLKFPSDKLLNISTNKSDLFKLCEENSISIPKTYFIDSSKDLNLIDFNNKYSFIIKPSMTIEGKKNIVKFSSKDELGSLYELVKESSRNKKVIIQEYIEGFDFNVLVKFYDNSFKIISSWDEYIAIESNNHIKGLGLSAPSKALQNKDILTKVNRLLEKFLDILKDEYYLVAFTLRVDNNDNIYIIEMHSDLIGDLIAEKLLPTSCKEFNFFKLVINFLLKEDFEEKFTFSNTMLLYNNDILLKNVSLEKEIDFLSKEMKLGKYKSLEYLDYLKGISFEN